VCVAYAVIALRFLQATTNCAVVLQVSPRPHTSDVEQNGHRHVHRSLRFYRDCYTDIARG